MDQPKADSKPKSTPSVPYSGKIIDIHTHVFNLKYLPVAGIIMTYGKNIIPREIAEGIEWLMLRKTKSVFDVPDSSNWIGTQTLKARLKKQLLNYTPFDAVKLNKVQLVAALGDLVLEQDLEGENKLVAAIREFKKIQPDFKPPKTGELKLASTTENLALFDSMGLLEAMFKWVLDLAESAENHFRWFLFMMNDEETIYRHLVTMDESRAEKHLFMMMDVDHFFNVDHGDLQYTSYFDFETEQIPNMKKMQERHPDKLISFVCYNPARNEGTLDIVKKAVSEFGYKGIKFYPPMGYKPYGDKRYGAQIKELMNYCSDGKIALFTHCNNGGFEAGTNFGHCSNPVYWEQVLIEHPDMRLCLGHGGGGEGWFSAYNEAEDIYDVDKINANQIEDESEKQSWNHSYAAMVYKLCVKYDNVYCDASYLDEMVNTDGSLNYGLQDNFKKRLLKCFKTNPKFSKKIMYGSDWHMLFREGKNAVYLDAYLRFYGQVEFDSYREDFFYNNAKRFLKELPVE